MTSDDMTGVRSAIPDYAGQSDAAARRLADQQVRAWVGERLAALRDRLPAAGDSEAFDDAILHCEFGDQRVIKALEGSRFGEPEVAAAVEAADARVLASAAAADRVDAAAAPDFVTGVRDALRARIDAIVALR
jgi:hypothetical protein